MGVNDARLVLPRTGGRGRQSLVYAGRDSHQCRVGCCQHSWSHAQCYFVGFYSAQHRVFHGLSCHPRQLYGFDYWFLVLIFLVRFISSSHLQIPGVHEFMQPIRSAGAGPFFFGWYIWSSPGLCESTILRAHDGRSGVGLSDDFMRKA